MQDRKSIEELRKKRELAYGHFISSFKGLKDCVRLLDERITRDGPTANYSMNSELVNWSMDVWKASNAIYNIDSMIEEIVEEQRSDPACATNKV